MEPPTFAQLRDRYPVTPIRGCPGRFIIHGVNRTTVEELVGGRVAVLRHVSPRARDTVVIARIAGGGIISYQRRDGSYVHSLCDDDGLARKLAQLGLPPDAA